MLLKQDWTRHIKKANVSDVDAHVLDETCCVETWYMYKDFNVFILISKHKEDKSKLELHKIENIHLFNHYCEYR